MRRSLIETLMGAVVLGVAVVFLAVAYTSADLGARGGYELHADFGSVGGLKVGSEVRMSGIKVGTISSLALNPKTYLARITVSIEDAIRLPADTSATIASEGLLGGNYLELVPGGAEDMLQPGDRIEYTQDAVDLVQLLGRFIFSAGDAKSGAQSHSPSTPQQ